MYTVKFNQIYSGPSIIKKSWTLYKDGVEIGSLTEGHMFEIGHQCTSGYIVRPYARPLQIYSTFQDAVVKGLGVTGTLDEIDAVLNLFFEQGYHLA